MKMSSYNYKIQLVPIDTFYFGSINHFGEKNSNTNMLKSEQWPQQTAVLGMLRKELLIQNELIRDQYEEHEKKDIQELIGKNGFVFKKGNEIGDFGAIKKVSPIMLTNKYKRVYTQCPRDCKAKVEKEYISFGINKNVIRTFSMKKGKEIEVPYFVRSEEEFNPKVGYSNDLVDIRTLEIKRIRDYIETVEKIGIHREQAEKALYKLISYRFDKRDDLRFICYVELDESKINSEFKSNIVQLGSKNSLFYMKVERLTQSVAEDRLFESKKWNEHATKIEEISSFRPIWVLSDTYLEQAEMEKIDYSVLDTKKFRYIYNQTGTHRFKKCEATYQFIARGSVLYCKDIEEVKKDINKYRFLKQIGYNYVI